MKIGPFEFGRNNSNEKPETVPVNSAEISFSNNRDDLDLSLYNVVEIDPEDVGGRDLFDSLVPLVGSVAEAAAQYDHAIVKFPEGIGWSDLLNRKTLGWERFKQCGGFGKNGKFNPQAAIRQVKVSPAAVANIALQAAAVAVGQAYMTEISGRLSGIEEGVSRIQREMQIERESKIEASFRMLKDYIEHFAEYSEMPEKRQAVLNSLENIRHEALAAWSFQIQSLGTLGSDVRKAGRLDAAGAGKFLLALEDCDKSAAAVYAVLMMENQAQLCYGSNFSADSLMEAKRRSTELLDEYDWARSAVQESLRKRIAGLKGKPFVPPGLEDDGFETNNPVRGFAHSAKRNAGRYLPPAMRNEAKRVVSEQKRKLSAAASAEGQVAGLAEKRRAELDVQNTMFNSAAAIVIDEERIRFLIPKRNDDENELAR